jgi:hypothetical protein
MTSFLKNIFRRKMVKLRATKKKKKGYNKTNLPPQKKERNKHWLSLTHSPTQFGGGSDDEIHLGSENHHVCL